MGVEISGGRQLRVAAEGLGRDLALEAARRWQSTSRQILIAEGDEKDYKTFPVAQATLPAEWDEAEGAASFGFEHVAAQYFNDGTTAHEIEADQAEMLAFEWPEIEGEEWGDTGKKVEEVFEETFPTVFLPEVNVEGIEAIRFLERGQQQASRWLESQEQ